MGSLGGGCGGLWWGSKAGGQNHSPRGPGVLGAPPPMAAVASSFSVYSLSASVPLVGLRTLGTVAQMVIFRVSAMKAFLALKLTSNDHVFQFWVPKPEFP